MLFAFLILPVLQIASTAAAAVSKVNCDIIGANYIQTNSFTGNQIIASSILSDGTLTGSKAYWTNGNGSASKNDPAPFGPHPDPFLSSNSVLVSQSSSQLYVINAGSSTFSIFSINPNDPAKLSLIGIHPSGGEFPVALAKTTMMGSGSGVGDGSDLLCVLNSGKVNGFKCYEKMIGGASGGDDDWNEKNGWERTFGLNLTTPPHGPVGGTPSDIIFSRHGNITSLIIPIKGSLPTDLNNPSGTLQPGYFLVYTITIAKNNNSSSSSQWTLSDQPTKKIQAGIPFSVAEDQRKQGVFFASDVSTGFASFEYSGGGNGNGTVEVVQGTIPNQAAACWAAQSSLTKNWYTIEIGGKSNITEISLDIDTLQGQIITHHGLGVNASGTDISIFNTPTKDFAYINAPSYKSIHVFEISGRGEFGLKQRWGEKEMGIGMKGLGMGFGGQAVYYKP